jgi:hypothetical protein
VLEVCLLLLYRLPNLRPLHFVIRGLLSMTPTRSLQEW